MIEQVDVKNFQSLADVNLPLGGFTVILGESDTGKSAIVRAVKAAVNNQTGQGFIRDGEKEAVVTFVEDDTEVVWQKGASAKYILSLCGGPARDDYEYDKARGVPDDINNCLRMTPVKIGDVTTDPNFHSQFDKPYLVAEPDTAKAKILGELSGVNLVYLATQEATKRSKRSAATVSSIKRDLEDYAGKLVEASGSLAELTVLCADVADRVQDIELLSGQADRAEELALEILHSELSTQHNKFLAGEHAAFVRAVNALAATEILYLKGNNLLANITERVDSISRLDLELQLLKEELEQTTSEMSHIEVCPTCQRPL